MSFDNQRMIFNLVTLVQFFSIPVMSSSLTLRCQKVKNFFGAKGQNFQQGLLSVLVSTKICSKKFHLSFLKRIQFFKSSFLSLSSNFHLDLGSLENNSWFIYLKKKKIQPLPITALRYFLLGWI